MTNSVSSARSRRSLASQAGHRLLAVAVMAGWVAMPMMPLLALAYTWISGLS